MVAFGKPDGQSIGIGDCRLSTPQEAKELCPIASTDGILGSMRADRKGYIDTTSTFHAYAGSAKKHEVEVSERMVRLIPYVRSFTGPELDLGAIADFEVNIEINNLN